MTPWELLYLAFGGLVAIGLLAIAAGTFMAGAKARRESRARNPRRMR